MRLSIVVDVLDFRQRIEKTIFLPSYATSGSRHPPRPAWTARDVCSGALGEDFSRTSVAARAPRSVVGFIASRSALTSERTAPCTVTPDPAAARAAGETAAARSSCERLPAPPDKSSPSVASSFSGDSLPRLLKPPKSVQQSARVFTSRPRRSTHRLLAATRRPHAHVEGP